MGLCNDLIGCRTRWERIRCGVQALTSAFVGIALSVLLDQM